MEQQRLKEYLSLIQKLLACPQGEEWTHLKHHEELVDAQFVQVMEQVATQLTRQGDREAAIFLLDAYWRWRGFDVENFSRSFLKIFTEKTLMFRSDEQF